MPQKTKPGPVAPEIGAPTSRNQERMDVASAINNLKAKQAKERLILGCTFDELMELKAGTANEAPGVYRAQCGGPDGQCCQKRRREEAVE
jgi:hypothetical protein